MLSASTITFSGFREYPYVMTRFRPPRFAWYKALSARLRTWLGCCSLFVGLAAPTLTVTLSFRLGLSGLDGLSGRFLGLSLERTVKEVSATVFRN